MTQHGPYVPQPGPYPPQPSHPSHPSQPGFAGRTRRPQARPVAVAASACMTIAGSATWLASLGLTWLTARYGRDQFNTADSGEAVLYYLLQRYDDRLAALWPPLVGFPLAALLDAFVLPVRSTGPRLAYTLLGVGAIAYVTWWWWGTWWVIVSPVAFIALALLMVWTPSANRWFRG